MSDVDVVLRNKNDYYKLLGTRDTGAALKTAYRRLCLKVHPDKNPGNPRAQEAIKIVNEAYECLSDPKKRAVYDRHGAEGARRAESTGSPHQHRGGGGGGGFYAAEEDIFAHFFGQAAGMGGRRRYQQQQGGHHRGGGNPGVHEFEINGNLVMLLPFLFFLLMAMLVQTVSVGGGFEDGSNSRSSSRGGSRGGGGMFGSGGGVGSGKKFSLKEENEYRVKRETSLEQYPHLKVKYFVDRYFNDHVRYRRINLRSVEMDVIKEHKEYLRRLCAAEQIGKRKEKPSCTRLQDYKNVG